MSILSSNVFAQEKTNMVRVRIEKGAPSLDLKIKGSYTIAALHTNERLEKSNKTLRTTKVIPTETGIKIGEKEYNIFGVRIIPTVGANIFIDKRRFRGIVDIVRTKEMELLVINHIDIEDYLFGVLSHETPHYWPMETLMAQAIAARTYALYRKEESDNVDYDLTSDTYSQVYGGNLSERWTTKRAVNLTRGKILTYKGSVLPAYYHAICGGHTEDAAKLWKKVNLPPLKGVECKFCKDARGFNWKAAFSYKQLEERLNNYGIKCKGVSYIVEGKRDESGRLEDIRIRDSKGVKDIPSDKFRTALSNSLIRSANFTIEITRAGIIFRGKGWGHGVGMCQWGAYGMTEQGYNHKQILEYYYPGAEIVKMSE